MKRLTTNEYERNGYSFVGWSTIASASSAQYQPGGTYTANGNKTLYALFTLNKFDLVVDN